jgi:hypothetical protein
MLSTQLRRAERAIEELRGQSELPPAVLDVLQELVDIARSLEARIVIIENNQS